MFILMRLTLVVGFIGVVFSLLVVHLSVGWCMLGFGGCLVLLFCFICCMVLIELVVG